MVVIIVCVLCSMHKCMSALMLNIVNMYGAKSG